jgi:hypothetical protein
MNKLLLIGATLLALTSVAQAQKTFNFTPDLHHSIFQ